MPNSTHEIRKADSLLSGRFSTKSDQVPMTEENSALDSILYKVLPLRAPSRIPFRHWSASASSNRVQNPTLPRLRSLGTRHRQSAELYRLTRLSCAVEIDSAAFRHLFSKFICRDRFHYHSGPRNCQEFGDGGFKGSFKTPIADFALGILRIGTSSLQLKSPSITPTEARP